MNSQQQNNELKELHATIHGKVQGVGFRYFAVQKALTLGLRGYARNVDDGSVEVLAQGPHPALENLLTHLRRGPVAADVADVEVHWSAEPSLHISGFHVRW